MIGVSYDPVGVLHSDRDGILMPVLPNVVHGVYVMRGQHRQEGKHRYYVGQTDNLRRRMGKYASASYRDSEWMSQEGRIMQAVLRGIEEGWKYELLLARAAEIAPGIAYDPTLTSHRKSLESHLVALYQGRGHWVENDDALE